MALTSATASTVGTSAKGFIDERVMLEAKRRLAHSDEPAVRIAAHLGFSSATNFSKYFQSLAGQSPIQFRNAARQVPRPQGVSPDAADVRPADSAPSSGKGVANRVDSVVHPVAEEIRARSRPARGVLEGFAWADVAVDQHAEALAQGSQVADPGRGQLRTSVEVELLHDGQGHADGRRRERGGHGAGAPHLAADCGRASPTWRTAFSRRPLR